MTHINDALRKAMAELDPDEQGYTPTKLMRYRLHSARRYSGRTLQDVANFLGVSRKTYNSYELHPHNMPVRVLVDVAQYLKRDVAFLLDGRETPATEDTIHGENTDDN